MSTLDDWTDTLCAELGLDQEDASQKTVLNLARVVAHTVDRPAGTGDRLLPGRCGRPRGTTSGNGGEAPAARPRVVG